MWYHHAGGMGLGRTFITLEGPEGCGKSTQAGMLARHLRARGLDVVKTREPGGTRIGRKIRRILLSPSNDGICREAELLLFLSSRAEHVARVIKPALEEGKVVVCDRFSDATFAYQGYGRGLDRKLISRMNEFATGGLKPDLTILLDVGVGLGLRRALVQNRGNADRIEKAELDFHERVRKGYLALARREPRRIKLISGEKSLAETHRIIRGYVDAIVGKRKKRGT